ncbi:MAG: hypothetical protein V4504_00580 [Patescibacteria group bacterium]
MKKEILTNGNLHEGKWILSVITEEEPQKNPEENRKIKALYFLTKYDSKKEPNWETKALNEEAIGLINGKHLGNPAEPILFGEVILRRFPEYTTNTLLEVQKQ